MHYLAWLLVAWAVSVTPWLLHPRHPGPDPAPDWRTFIGTSVAGIIGGLIGGQIFSASDPMPAHPLIGVGAGAVILTGAALTAFRR